MSKYKFLVKESLSKKYTIERLRGITHEAYCLECTEKGLLFELPRTTWYEFEIITHPITKEKALKIDTETVISPKNKTQLDFLPENFHNKLSTYEEMEADGWFNTGLEN